MLSTTFCRNLCAVFRYVAFIRRRCARRPACLILRLWIGSRSGLANDIRDGVSNAAKPGREDGATWARYELTL